MLTPAKPVRKAGEHRCSRCKAYFPKSQLTQLKGCLLCLGCMPDYVRTAPPLLSDVLGFIMGGGLNRFRPNSPGYPQRRRRS